MEGLTGIEPLQETRDTKILLQAEKYLAKRQCPMAEKLGNLAKGRLKRSSFTHKAKRLRRQHLSELPNNVSALSSVPKSKPWVEKGKVPIIRTSVKGIHPGEPQNILEMRTATLGLLEETYPADQWIRIYTDGSATKAVRKGGAGIVIDLPGKRRHSFSKSTREFCSNYEAEVSAIVEAAVQLWTLQTEAADVVFLTDARSVLEALQADKLPHVENAMGLLEHAERIVLQWIPSHCGVEGNEMADKLAKEGATAEQPDAPITYKEKRTLIKATRRKPPAPKDDYHALNRQQQVIIFRLRTDHNRLRWHLFKKFKIGTSGGCDCGSPRQDAEHTLQHCSNLEAMRRKHWPDSTPLERKLYGPLPELIKTADFITKEKEVCWFGMVFDTV